MLSLQDAVSRSFQLLLLLMVFSSTVHAQLECARVALGELDRPLKAVNSVTTASRGLEAKLGKPFDAVLVDNVSGQVAALASDGTLQEISARGRLEPMALSRVGHEYLGVGRGASLYRYDRGLRYRGPAPVAGLQKARSEGPRALEIYNHATVGNLLFGYGYLELKPGTTLLGFLRFSASQGAGQAELVMPFDRLEYYLLNESMVTSLGGNFYAVLAGDYPELLRYSVDTGTTEILHGLPGQHTPLPVVDLASLSRAEAISMTKQLEAPVSLRGQSGFLYLLRRQQQVDGFSFVLHKLRPLEYSLEEVGEYTVATDADHLTMVTTPSQLYFIEKSDVLEDGGQRVASMRVCARP